MGHTANRQTNTELMTKAGINTGLADAATGFECVSREGSSGDYKCGTGEHAEL